MLLLKIPKQKKLSTAGVSLDELDEPFVDIASFSGGAIVADMKYADAGRPGAIRTAYVRLGVAERLIRAASLLPSGYKLKVYDTWRPYTVQKSIYDEYFDSLRALPENADKSTDELHALARRYVSYPEENKRLSYVHSSGGAVDLTIIDAEGRELDMGSGFDEFSPFSALDALEGTNTPAEENRRLLYTVMTDCGFTPFGEEWWHYDYGDLFWAATLGVNAIYPSAYREEELNVR